MLCDLRSRYRQLVIATIYINTRDTGLCTIAARRDLPIALAEGVSQVQRQVRALHNHLHSTSATSLARQPDLFGGLLAVLCWLWRLHGDSNGC